MRIAGISIRLAGLADKRPIDHSGQLGVQIQLDGDCRLTAGDGLEHAVPLQPQVLLDSRAVGLDLVIGSLDRWHILILVMADVILQKIYETLHAHRIAALAIEQADTRIEKHSAGGREKVPAFLDDICIQAM